MAGNMFIGVFMPILTLSIISYTCYQYVFNVHGILFENETRWDRSKKNEIFRVSVALFLCTASLVSYAAIILTRSNPIPLNKETVDKPFEFPQTCQIINDSPVVALSLSSEKGQPLFCQICKTIKPERAHHCKECQRCALKMDHHCVWINGCVDKDNYKCFFLFILYVALYSLWVEFTLGPMLYRAVKSEIGEFTLDFFWKAYKVYISCIYYFWRNVTFMVWNRQWIPLLSGAQGLNLHISIHWYITTALGFLFGLVLTGFTGAHFWYIIKNRTSIEHVSTRPYFVRADFDESGRNFEVIVANKAKLIFDRGLYYNWSSVMGSNPFIWWVPMDLEQTKIYSYNVNFCKEIVQLALKQREERLRELSK